LTAADDERNAILGSRNVTPDPQTATAGLASPASGKTHLLARILRPHWKTLLIALVAVIGETAADILEPWPITIVVDNVLQGKRLEGVLGGAVRSIFGQNTSALLTFALTAVLVIAIVGGISTYVEKYLTTTVSQWVAHDLRMLL